jgi:hypothetical protein
MKSQVGQKRTSGVVIPFAYNYVANIIMVN